MNEMLTENEFIEILLTRQQAYDLFKLLSDNNVEIAKEVASFLKNELFDEQ